MVYSNFINKTTKYLKSVRVLKNYVSFDMIFPKTWVFPKNYPQGIEVLVNENEVINFEYFLRDLLNTSVLPALSAELVPLTLETKKARN